MHHRYPGHSARWRWRLVVPVALALLTGCASSSVPVSPLLRTATPYPSPTPYPTATPRLRLSLAPTATAEPAGLAAASLPATPMAFDGEAAYRHVEELSIGIGARPAGDAGEAEAAAYIATHLESLGYTVTRQPFPITVFRDRGSTLTYDQGTRRLWPLPMLYSGVGQVEGRLVEAGLGRPEDFRDGAVRGAIALVRRGGGLTFLEKVRHARAAGARAVVIVNDRNSPLRGSVTEAVDLPVVGISRLDGVWLRRRLSAGATPVRLTVDATTEPGQSVNLTATRPGDDANRPTVILGAHYDTADGPGANVNASGVGVLLELVRRLATEQRIEPRFVVFGAGELGQIGSRAYVNQLTIEERHRVVAMVELTAVGLGPVIGVSGHEGLATRVVAAGDQLGLMIARPATPVGGDHTSFGGVGIPAIAIYRLASGSDQALPDRAQFVTLEALRTVGDLCLHVIHQLAAGDTARESVSPTDVRSQTEEPEERASTPPASPPRPNRQTIDIS